MTGTPLGGWYLPGLAGGLWLRPAGSPRVAAPRKRHCTRDCTRGLVPSLVVTPLIENAVKHGLRGPTSSVSIEIDVQRRGSRLYVGVSNTCSAAVGASGIGTGIDGAPHPQGAACER